NDKVYIGTSRYEIEVRLYPDGELEPTIAHFTQPVTCLQIEQNTIYAGTRDFKVCSIDLNDNRLKYFDGHQAPILSVQPHLTKYYLATSCCDGFVRIFNMNDQTIIKQFDLIKKSNDIDSTLARMDWDRSTDILAIPVQNSVTFYDTTTWTIKQKFKDDTITDFVNLVRYSSSSKYLAVGYVNGQISILEKQTLKIIITYTTGKKKAICSLAWNPNNDDSFTFATIQVGDFGIVDISDSILEQQMSSIEQQPKSVLKKKIDNEDDTLEKSEIPIIDLEENEEEDEILGFVDDISSSPKAVTSVKPPTVVQEIIHHGYEPPELQESFQPTSTSKYLDTRFMIWNSVGAITCYSCDDQNSIQVTFHDVTFHHAIHINNTIGYKMASLSNQAVLLATSKQFMCLLYQSWDTQNEWTMQITNGQIEAITLGDQLIAIVTSQRLIRFFTLSGIQQQIVCIQGPILSICAHKHTFWAIYHSTMGLPKETALSYIYLDTKKNIYLEGSLPFTPKSKLTWIG
ncbi:unnamed protein product, partial [Didymodactylos carnosus]